MPQLGEYKALLDCVFFLYDSADGAKTGEPYGATGFFVSVPSKKMESRLFPYAVTNWHAAVEGKNSVIGVNTVDGSRDAIVLKPEDWHYIPGKHDIAVAPLHGRNDAHKIKFLHPSYFMSDDEEIGMDINAGDDVFMVGRFVDYDGIQTNQPAVRFGHISISNANVKQGTDYKGRSIVVDMHSRTGFSGSPVFVYRTAGSVFPPQSPTGRGLTWGGGHVMKLLGIHWGQFPEKWELREGGITEADLITDGQYVKGLSGMTCVCPCSAIQELLYLPELVKMREMEERTWNDSDPVLE
jgi:hypothetical protein